MGQGGRVRAVRAVRRGAHGQDGSANRADLRRPGVFYRAHGGLLHQGHDPAEPAVSGITTSADAQDRAGSAARQPPALADWPRRRSVGATPDGLGLAGRVLRVGGVVVAVLARSLSDDHRASRGLDGVGAAVSVRRDHGESRAGAFSGRPGCARKDGGFAGPRREALLGATGPTV